VGDSGICPYHIFVFQHRRFAFVSARRVWPARDRALVVHKQAEKQIKPKMLRFQAKTEHFLANSTIRRVVELSSTERNAMSRRHFDDVWIDFSMLLYIIKSAEKSKGAGA
jgi:hypothetical protein